MQKRRPGAMMQLIASEALRGSRALRNVVREMSLTPCLFSSAAALADRMAGTGRRVVLLADADVRHEIIDALCAVRARVGIIVAADRSKLRCSDKAVLIDRLRELSMVEWIDADFDFETLAAAARCCRRRMLTIASHEIERGFLDAEFIVRYQPKVERDSGAEWVTREAEALVRWQHPQHGIMGPLEFLPEIEAFGMTARLADHVLEKSAAQLREWQEQGMTLNGCINLATSLLSDTTLAARFAGIVEAAGIDCDRFTFELVEHDLADPSAPHLRTLDSLRERGFRLCLDDFRVAAASLAAFERLPFDEIKIDALALRSAQQNSVALHVLAAVTGLAHKLGMSVCVEGVEDEGTFEFMQMIDCDKMQGFLISEAVLPHIIQRSYSAGESTFEVA